MSGPYWRGLPGETQLSHSLLSLLCFSRNEELLQGSLARVAGEAEFQSYVASSEPPTRQGAWPRRGESPRASDLRRMSCVRILTQRVWSTCRLRRQGTSSVCSQGVLPWVGRRVFGEGDEAFQLTVLRGGPMKELTAKGQSKRVLTGTSYWGSKSRTYRVSEALPLVAVLVR